MEPESGGERDEDKLRAEREAILKQLELLGSESESEDDDEDQDREEFDNEEVVIKEEKIEPEDEFSLSNQSLENYGEPQKIEEVENLEEYGDETSNQNKECSVETDGDEEKPGARVGCSEMSSENDRAPPVAVEKTVMDRIDIDKDNPLPDGWTLITHYSGMPVYYHKFTQVVTHSRPYQIEGLVRDHQIPVSSIPCLFRQIMNERHEDVEIQCSQRAITQEERQRLIEIPLHEKKLTPEQYRAYCEKKFKFKKITVHRYTNQEEKQGAVQKKRLNSMLKKKGFELDYDQLKKKNSPGDVLLSSASGACLIDLTPVQASLNNKKGGPRKPYLLNPMGKTTVAVLNEFVQRLAKGTLVYEVEDTRNVSCPYKATAMLTMKMSTIRELAGQCKESLIVLSEIAATSDNVPAAPGIALDYKRFAVGSGVGANKKTARLVAAKDALSKIIPKLRMSDDYVCDGVLEEGLQKGFEEESRELFKKVKIDSPNLVAMCTRFAIPKPYSLLRDAVSRSLRWNGMELTMKKEMVGNGSQLSKVVLGLGDMEGEAEAIGVKQATQMASQLLFKKMHPELQTYGSFLEVYGRLNDKVKLDTAKKQHDEVVRLQDTGNLLQPNVIVLAKLREEMQSICLVHPPRKFLYGLAPHAAGVRSNKASVSAQTDDYPFISNINPMPMPIVTPPFFQGLPIQPIMHPVMNPPQFIGQPPPPRDYLIYKSPQFYQKNTRKRGRPDEQSPSSSSYPTPSSSYSTSQRPPIN